MFGYGKDCNYICCITEIACNMEVLLTKEYITGLIASKGLSKAEFASRMGIVRQNLDSMLDSRKKDINTVIKMAEVLDIPLLEFIGMQPKENTIYGCLYVNDKPVLVNSWEDLEILMNKKEQKDTTN